MIFDCIAKSTHDDIKNTRKIKNNEQHTRFYSYYGLHSKKLSALQ